MSILVRRHTAAKPQSFWSTNHTNGANPASLRQMARWCGSWTNEIAPAARALMVAVLPLALAACADRADAPLSPGLGAAVASMDSQIIDPVPAEGIPEGSGARASAAIKRYETGRVKAPPGAGSGSAGVSSGAPEDPPASNPGTPK